MFYGEALEIRLSTQKLLSNLFQSSLAVPKWDREMWGEQSKLLAMSNIFWWNKETAAATKLAAENFPTNVPFSRDMLYCDHGWCFFDHPQYFISDDRTTNLTPVRAMLWSYCRWTKSNYEGLSVSSYVESALHGALAPIVHAQLKAGDSLSSDPTSKGIKMIWQYISDGQNKEQTRQEQLNSLRFILAAGAFLRQRILTTQEEQPERHTRKRIAREIGNIPLPSIQVVQLRRTASATHDSASVTERDYHCQWMVRGHWRNQYYASSGDHIPKYIHPYIKGPEDKPLKPPSGEIFAVTR